MVELLKSIPPIIGELCNADGTHCASIVSNSHIADYLLKNGVIVPPCKVGDTVYLIMAAYSTLDKSTYFAVPIEGVVDCISFCGKRGNEIDIRLNSDFGGEIVFRTFEDYKKSFFLDRKEAVVALQDIIDEEAEQALKEREKGDK